MKALIFARGYNITGQVQECRKYAEKQGLTVTGVIVAQGSELPAVVGGFDEDIKKVIIYDAARISRKPLEYYAISAELELDYGVSIEIASAQREKEARMQLMRSIIAAARY